jgi:uncharacterized caspase-like protein
VNDLHYAVVVGIDRYPGITDLSGAKADADAFCAWLTADTGGQLPAANVKRVMATPQEEAGYALPRDARPINVEIDYALEEVSESVRDSLSDNLSAWDRTRLYLYVAGHGFAPQGGEGALLLANAEEGALSRNIELPEYRRWCSACAWFSELLVFADCCRTRVTGGVPGVGPLLDECLQPFVDKETTWMVGFGSALGHPTYEAPAGSDDEARGYFTRALLQGLSGDARDETGAVTVNSLAGFVRERVAQITRDKPYPQNAQFIGELAVSIVLSAGSAAPRPQRTVRIAFPAGFAGRVALRRNLELAGSHDAASGPWTVRLEDGYYEVVPDSPDAGVSFARDGLFKVVGGDVDVQL